MIRTVSEGPTRDDDEPLRVEAVCAAGEISIHARAGQSCRRQQVLQLLPGINPVGELECSSVTRSHQGPAVAYPRPVVDDFVSLEQDVPVW